MICPKCNSKNPDENTKCSNCGVTLPSRDDFDSLSGMKTIVSTEGKESTLKKGSLFAGRYEIIEDGLQGGMGMVYKVKDNTLGKVKALKIILPVYLENEKAISRFKQEVAITQELLHENIVRVYDIGESEGTIYFTMEWIDGISLRDYINDRKKRNNRFSLEETENIAKQLCSALSYAHKIIIHRDIKPENIIVINPDSQKPLIKITDFGIAKTESQSVHVSMSSYMGTPIYMAPEQYTDASHADKRADIYSVGVIIYELLTFLHPLGTFPMPSEVNSSLPKKVDDVIKKALSADKTKRYDDAMDIVKALETSIIEAASQEKPIKQPSYTPTPVRVTTEKKKSMLFPLIAGSLVIMVGIILVNKFLFPRIEPDIVTPPPPVITKPDIVTPPPIVLPPPDTTGPKRIQSQGFTIQINECKISGGEARCSFSLTDDMAEQFQVSFSFDNQYISDDFGNQYRASSGVFGRSLGRHAMSDLLPQVKENGYFVFKNVPAELKVATMTLNMQYSNLLHRERSQSIKRGDVKVVFNNVLLNAGVDRQDTQDRKDIQGVVSRYLAEGKNYYNLGKYELCIEKMKEVLERDRNNNEAKQYIKMAKEQLDEINRQFRNPNAGRSR